MVESCGVLDAKTCRINRIKERKSNELFYFCAWLCVFKQREYQVLWNSSPDYLFLTIAPHFSCFHNTSYTSIRIFHVLTTIKACYIKVNLVNITRLAVDVLPPCHNSTSTVCQSMVKTWGERMETTPDRLRHVTIVSTWFSSVCAEWNGCLSLVIFVLGVI